MTLETRGARTNSTEAKLAKTQELKNQVLAELAELKNPSKKETFSQSIRRQIAEKNREKNQAVPPPKKPDVNEIELAEEGESNKDSKLDAHDAKMIAYAQERTRKNAEKNAASDARVDKIAGFTKRTLEKGSAAIEKIVDTFREDEEEKNLSPEEIAVRKKWQKGREIVTRRKKHDAKMISRAEEKTKKNAESEARVNAIADVTKQTLEKASTVIENLKHKAGEGAKFAGSAIANREGFGMEMTGVPDEAKEASVKKEPSPFTHLFGNLAEKLTEKVPGFEKLSNGQQLLVMQGIQERIYKTVKSEAKELHAESVKKSGFFGKIGKNIGKNFLTAKNETEVLKHFKNDTDGKLSALLEKEGVSVAERIAKSGLEGYLAADKKTIITDYAGLEKNLGNNSEYTKAMAGEFNQAASKMARIPKEWSYPEASRAQKEAYKQAENALMIARDRFLPMLAADNANLKVPNAKLEAAAVVKNSETMMETMRFLSADPNTMKRLESIGTTSTILRGLNNTVTEKGAFVAGGYLGRTVFAGALGSLAGPTIAFITGGVRGYNKAKSTIREQAEFARSGSIQKRDSKEAIKRTEKYAPLIAEARSAMANASTEEEKKEILAQIQKYSQLMNAGGTSIGTGSSERHMKRLADTLAAIEITNIEPERQQLLSKLKTYTDFIEAKVELGQVNFGSEKDAFARQYDLMEKLHEAKATIGVHLQHDVYAQAAEKSMHAVKNQEGEEYTVTLSHDMRGLIQRMGGANQANVEKARTMMVTKEIIKGATLGAMFATAGVWLRNFGEAHGWIDGKTPNTVPGKNTTGAGSTVEAVEEKIRALKDTARVQHTPLENPVTPKTEISPLESSELRTLPTSSTETFSPTERALPVFPSSESIEATESVIPRAITETEIKPGEGAGHALLRIKDNPNLTDGQKEFFKRNLWAVTKDLRMIDPATGGSVVVHPGDVLAFEEDGSVVITNPNNPSLRTVYGVIREDGELIKNTSDEFRYRLPQLRNLERIDVANVKEFSLDSNTESFVPSEREIPSELSPEFIEGAEDVVSPVASPVDGIDRLDATNYKFSDKTLDKITRLEHRRMDGELTKYFGEDYEQSRTWKTVSKMDAQEFLERRREDFSSEYVGFYDDVTELANKLPLDPTGKNLEQYLNGLYEFNERDLAFKKELAELTRERIVLDLKKVFGDQPWKSTEWKKVGDMNAFEFFAQNRADLSDSTKLFYDNISKLITRVGKGPEVLPEGERTIKNYLEYLYEMDTRNVLHAEVYNE